MEKDEMFFPQNGASKKGCEGSTKQEVESQANWNMAGWKTQKGTLFPVMCNSAGKFCASIQWRTNQILERDNQIYSSSPCYSRKSNVKVISNALHPAFSIWVAGAWEGQVANNYR